MLACELYQSFANIWAVRPSGTRPSDVHVDESDDPQLSLASPLTFDVFGELAAKRMLQLLSQDFEAVRSA
eukprot:800440-Pleurochrysis_carterae.AAC.1